MARTQDYAFKSIATDAGNAFMAIYNTREFHSNRFNVSQKFLNKENLLNANILELFALIKEDIVYMYVSLQFTWRGNGKTSKI